MKINGETGILGILGDPIRHTLSPDIHNMLSEELGINEVYVPFHVQDNLRDAVNGAYAMHVLGLNVTVPHKQAVMPYLSEVDEAAAKIGAVNTLVRTENGFKGYNTDMMGLKRAVAREGIILKDEAVIVIGAGGASRAVCYMCLLEGAAKVYLINRTLSKAENLAADMNDLFQTDKMVPIQADCVRDIPSGSYFMFQCTSLGLHEGDGLLIDSDEFYDMAKAGYDLIYNPAETPFMRELKKRNIPVFNGLTMLLYQGIIAYELWNDIAVNDDLCDKVLNRLKRNIYGDNIILVGYMGSGKTTIGKKLAKERHMAFVDTDRYIKEREGVTINEIFKRIGESGFRTIETDVLQELNKSCCNTVISTGGGIVLKEENRKLMKKMGNVIFLNASSEEIYTRLKGDNTRPLLAGGTESEIKERIQNMLEMRMPYYISAADTVVSVDGCSANYVVDKIQKIYHS